MKIEPTCPDCGCARFDIGNRDCFCAGCGWELLPDGYLYIIKANEVPEPFCKWGNTMYKIGRSKDPEQRLKQHKSRLWRDDLELVHTMPTNDMKESERELLARLEKTEGAMNVRGEWYILDGPALRGIQLGYVFCQKGVLS